MADKNVSFNEILQASRKKRKAEELANEMLGKNRRSSAPIAPKAGGSLASRVGVTKRTSSLPRMNDRRVRNARNPTSNLSRPPLNQTKSTPVLLNRDSRGPGSVVARNNIDNGSGLSIRGAAGPTGPFVVMAANFAEGTTAADISSVMANIGGETPRCRIMQKFPSVMAEVVFNDKRGAENVIETFNNQKADGRVLRVYMKSGGPAPDRIDEQKTIIRQPEPASVPFDEEMEVDENVESREEQDRLREERRGRDDRPRRDDAPRGPRSDRRYDGYYGRDNRPPQSDYQDSRSGFQGGRGGGYGGGRGRGGGRAPANMGQNWQAFR